MALRHQIAIVVRTGRVFFHAMLTVLDSLRPYGICHRCQRFVFEGNRALDEERRVVHNTCQQAHYHKQGDPSRFARWDMFYTVANPFSRIFGKSIHPVTERIIEEKLGHDAAVAWLDELERMLDAYATDDLRRYKAKPARDALKRAREFLPSLALIAA